MAATWPSAPATPPVRNSTRSTRADRDQLRSGTNGGDEDLAAQPESFLGGRGDGDATSGTEMAVPIREGMLVMVLPSRASGPGRGRRGG
jgi:hypothetical protein